MSALRPSSGLLRPLLAWVVVGTLQGCGGGTRVEDRPDPLSWASGTPDPRRSPYDLSVRGSSVLGVPWAGDAGPDVELPYGPEGASPLRLILNLETPDDSQGGACTVYFRGNSYVLTDPDGPRIWNSMRVNVQRLIQSWHPRAVAVLVRADYVAPWRAVRDVLAFVTGLEGPVSQLHFQVRCLDRWCEGRIAVEPIPGSDLAGALAKPIALAWSLAASPPAGMAPSRGASPVLQWGERVWHFPGGDPYEAGAGLDLANAHWKEVVTDLRTARATGAVRATLDIAAGVPWAHVAQTLGLLLAAAIPEVVMDGLPAWRLSTPPRGAVRELHRQLTHDVPAALALALGALTALGLCAVVLVLSRRSRAAVRRNVPSRG